LELLLFFIIICVLFYLASIILPILLIIFLAFLIICFTYQIYLKIFLHSKKFLDIKKSIEKNTNECNELNQHINELKNTIIQIVMELLHTLTLANLILKGQN